MEIWKDMATWFAGITSTFGVLLYGGIQRGLNTKAEKESLEEVRRQQNINTAEIGRMYSRLNDTVENFRAQHDELLKIIHANHLAVIERIARKQDRGDGEGRT